MSFSFIRLDGSGYTVLNANGVEIGSIYHPGSRKWQALTAGGWRVGVYPSRVEAARALELASR